MHGSKCIFLLQTHKSQETNKTSLYILGVIFEIILKIENLEVFFCREEGFFDKI